MMLYQNRVFVATSSVHDFNEDEGFGVVKDNPLVPRIFVPVNASVYGDSIIRMGVMGLYSMQKSIHQWFTSGAPVEVTESMWTDAIEEHQIIMPCNIVLETKDKVWVAFIAPARIISKSVDHDKQPAELEEAEAEEEPKKRGAFSMQLLEVEIPGMLFTDSMLVLGNQCANFKLSTEITRLPAAITGQLVLDMFNQHGKQELYKWEPSEQDTVGINETLVPVCSSAQLRGYAQFLNEPPPTNKQMYS